MMYATLILLGLAKPVLLAFQHRCTYYAEPNKAALLGFLIAFIAFATVSQILNCALSGDLTGGALAYGLGMTVGYGASQSPRVRGR